MELRLYLENEETLLAANNWEVMSDQPNSLLSQYPLFLGSYFMEGGNADMIFNCASLSIQ